MEMLSDSDKLRAVREGSGCPFLDCRKALEACSWDVDKALVLLRQQTRESMMRFGGIMDGP